MLLCSCQKFEEGRRLFNEILVLRDALTKEFHEQEADVVIDASKHTLTVKFINSPLLSASSDAKQQRADAVATFVVSRYKHLPSTVLTEFVSKRGSLSISQTFEGHPATNSSR